MLRVTVSSTRRGVAPSVALLQNTSFSGIRNSRRSSAQNESSSTSARGDAAVAARAARAAPPASAPTNAVRVRSMVTSMWPKGTSGRASLDEVGDAQGAPGTRPVAQALPDRVDVIGHVEGQHRQLGHRDASRLEQQALSIHHVEL